MSKKQKALLALQIACGVLLAVLPFVDQARINRYTDDDIRKHLYTFVLRYNLYLAVICGGLVAFAPALKDIFYPREKNKQVREKIMETMMEELFGGQRQNVRITIFKDAGVFVHSWIYLRLLAANIRAGRKWLPPRGKYVYVKERLGTEFSRSKTFFYYSPATRKKCHGVAGIVRQSLEVMILKNLPDIEGIDLRTLNMANKRSPDVRAVQDYIDQSYLRDFESLKRIHSPARHFYGSILQNNESPKGVLVIDSVQNDCPFEDPLVLKRLSYYSSLFTPTM